MKKYEFVRVESQNSKILSSYFEKHREIIEKYASDGYTYVGFIPTKNGPSGKIISFDLVFEKDM